MQRVRALGWLAVVSLVGVFTVSGCRSAPTAAAYVGEEVYTQQEVQDILTELQNAVESATGSNDSAFEPGSMRQTVVSYLVVNEVARKVAADRGIAVPVADLQVAVSVLGLPAEGVVTAAVLETRCARIAADLATVVMALQAATTAVDPTEAEQRQVFESLRYQGQRVSDSFESLQPAFTRDSIGHPVALGRWLNEGVSRYRATVNPRYAPLAWQVSVQLTSAVTASVSVPLVTR